MSPSMSTLEKDCGIALLGKASLLFQPGVAVSYLSYRFQFRALETLKEIYLLKPP